MEIQSVTSSIGAYVNNGNQTNQAPQNQSVQQAQQPESRQARPEERVEQREEAKRPVTNVQGQQTGTLINVTA